MHGTGRLPGRRDAQLVFQLENNSFGRFFSEAADFRKRRYIGVYNRRFETVNAHSAENSEGQFWTDAAHVIDQQSKKIALSRRHESVKDLCIFPHVQMSQNANILASCRQFVVARKRNKNFVTNSANIDNCLRGQRADQFAV